MAAINSVGWNTPSNTSGNISEILSHVLSQGIQRPNRYSVQFHNPPNFVTHLSPTDTIIATMVQLPQRSINYFSDSVGAFSPYWDVPLKTEFDDHFIINFIVDAGWKIRKFIEAWMGSVSGETPDKTNIGGEGTSIGSFVGKPSSMVGINNFVDNNCIIKLKPLPTNTTTSIPPEIWLYQAWPKLILPSQFDNNANNMPLILSVDFSYRYYKYVIGSNVQDLTNGFYR